MRTPALSATIIRTAFVLALLITAGQSARAVNDSMTALNNQGDIAFIESPGEDVDDNAGISLKIRRGSGTTVLASNDDLLFRECIGGSNSGNSCTSDANCPSGDCVDGFLTGFAKRVCLNDSGLAVTRVGVDFSPGMTCSSFGPNADEPCSSDADCTGSGSCEERDADQGAAIITAGVGGTNVIVRTCNTVGTDTITCPDPGADINNAGQVGFSADITTSTTYCDSLQPATTFCTDDRSLPMGFARAVYRFTPGTGIETMLRDGDTVGANTVVEAAQEDTEQGRREGDADSKLNAAGQMLVMSRYNNAAQMDADALLLLRGPGDRVEIAREDGVGGSFSEVEKGMLNSANPAQVLYKACSGGTRCSNSTAENLFLFTDGSGSQTLAEEGDNLPGGGGQFEGFGRFSCLNDLGQAAFVAGLKGTPSGTTPTNFSGGGDFDPQPQGLYFWNGSSLTEIARTASADGGTFVSSFNGFRFDWFVNAVTLNNAGTVCFSAEQAAPAATTSENEPTAVFCWDAATGIREIYRDGVFVVSSADTALVPAMQTMKRTLNQQGDVAFVVDPTGSVDESDDNFVLFTSLAQGRQVAPALSLGVMAILIVIFAVAGIRSVRRRRIV